MKIRAYDGERVKPRFKLTLFFISLEKVYRAMRNRQIDKATTLIYVHIGKCGGASLKRAISESPKLKRQYDRVQEVHITKPPIFHNAHYMIVIRNPIQRAISAFNWRYALVVKDGTQRDRFTNEYDILKKYETLNNLGESLYTGQELSERGSTDFENIHHLHERISFYLTDLIAKVNPEQIQFVLAQESLQSDIESMLEVQNDHQIHKHGGTVALQRKHLSATAYTNLKRYMRDDYRALEKLLSVCNTCGAENDVLLS